MPLIHESIQKEIERLNLGNEVNCFESSVALPNSQAVKITNKDFSWFYDGNKVLSLLRECISIKGVRFLWLHLEDACLHPSIFYTSQTPFKFTQYPDSSLCLGEHLLDVPVTVTECIETGEVSYETTINIEDLDLLINRLTAFKKGI